MAIVEPIRGDGGESAEGPALTIKRITKDEQGNPLAQTLFQVSGEQTGDRAFWTQTFPEMFARWADRRE